MRDELGESRIQFPHAMYMVAGSQADAPGNNVLTVARLTQLSKMRNGEDDSDDSDDSDEEGDASRQPVLQSRSIAHHGYVALVCRAAIPARSPARAQGCQPYSSAAAGAARGRVVGRDRPRAGVGRQAAAAGAERRDWRTCGGDEGCADAAASGVHWAPNGRLCAGLVARGCRPPPVGRLQRRCTHVGASRGRTVRPRVCARCALR